MSVFQDTFLFTGFQTKIFLIEGRCYQRLHLYFFTCIFRSFALYLIIMKDRTKKELKKIGERLHKIRKELGLTQLEIVKNLNFHRANFSRIESGQVMPNLDLLLMLYRDFRISLDWLITGEGSMFREEKDS